MKPRKNAKRDLKKFLRKERVTWNILLRPVQLIKLLYKAKFIHYFLVGISGVFINLFLTWFLTTFFFGVDNYFHAYLIGLSANIIYNFTLHSTVSFNTKKYHTKRFFFFAAYSLGMAALQAIAVKATTNVIGNELYLLVVVGYIILFSLFNFVFFKAFLFNER